MSSSEFILNNFSVLHEPLFYVYTFVLSLKPLLLNTYCCSAFFISDYNFSIHFSISQENLVQQFECQL